MELLGAEQLIPASGFFVPQKTFLWTIEAEEGGTAVLTLHSPADHAKTHKWRLYDVWWEGMVGHPCPVHSIAIHYTRSETIFPKKVIPYQGPPRPIRLSRITYPRYPGWVRLYPAPESKHYFAQPPVIPQPEGGGKWLAYIPLGSDRVQFSVDETPGSAVGLERDPNPTMEPGRSAPP